MERKIVDAGTGPVYLGHGADGRPVLIKTISATLSRDLQFRRLLHADLENVRRLSPFCLAAVLAADTTANPPYVVTEFVDAPTLATTVDAHGPLSAPDIHRLAVSLVTALAALHSTGLLFGDLKPGNIVLSGHGLRLVDFGLARVLNSLGGASRGGVAPAMGTPAFITPEHALGRPLTPASDIFTWGGVILFAATGRLPFGMGTARVLLQRAVYAEPDVSGLEQPLRQLVAEAMRKDPARRPDAGTILSGLIAARADAAALRELPGPPPAEIAPPLTRVSPPPPMVPTQQRPDDKPAANPSPARSGPTVPDALDPLDRVVLDVVTASPSTEVAAPDTAPDTTAGTGDGTAPDAVADTTDHTADDAAGSPAGAEAARPAGTVEDAKEVKEKVSKAVKTVKEVRAAKEAAEEAAEEGREAVRAAEAAGETKDAEAVGVGVRPDGNWLPRLLVIGAAASALMLTALAIADTVRGHADARASSSAARAASRLLVTEPHLAGQLAVAAYDLAPTSAAGSALVAATVRQTGQTTGPVRDLAVTSAGQRMITVGDFGAVVWDLTDPGRVRETARFAENVALTAVAVVSGGVHPAGDLVVTADVDRVVRLWRLTGDGQVEPAGETTGHTNRISDLEVSRDGRLVASASADGTVRLWNIGDPAEPAPLAVVALPASATTVAFAPGGGRLLAAGVGYITLWSLADPGAPRLQGMVRGSATVAGGAFTSDGRVLAVASVREDGGRTGQSSIVELFRANDPRGLRRFSAFTPEQGAGALAFSADGRSLAVGGASGEVTVWDTTSRLPRQRLVLPAENAATATVLVDSPAGRMLAVADGTGARMWELEPVAARRQICARVDEPLSRADWRTYLPDRPYSAPCG